MRWPFSQIIRIKSSLLIINDMYHVWSKKGFRQRTCERNVIFIKLGEDFKFTSVEVMPIQSLQSNQVETRSRVVMYSNPWYWLVLDSAITFEAN